jgi:poly(3-hydroxybutyrate) depolymerase
LVNQMAIETKLPSIRNYVAVVSPLNVWQHDGTHFKAKGDDNNYKTPVVPMTGKRLLNVSGTEDRLVPYRGGPSRGIPAKGGKLAFVDAEESIFLWAKAMGYDGDKLAQPTRVDGRLEIFSYLDGAVVHYKAVGQGHGSGGAISESVLFGFLVGRSK